MIRAMLRAFLAAGAISPPVAVVPPRPMAQGRVGPPRILHIDPAHARRNPSILARIARALRGER